MMATTTTFGKIKHIWVDDIQVKLALELIPLPPAQADIAGVTLQKSHHNFDAAFAFIMLCYMNQDRVAFTWSTKLGDFGIIGYLDAPT